MSRFENKVVFITGGTSGIGLATAVAFAREGATHVIVCGRTPEKWNQAQEYINKNLSSNQKIIEYIQCDVRVEQQVHDIIKLIFEMYGHLDICFNNAGISPKMDDDITKSTFMSDVDSTGSIFYILPPPEPYSTVSLPVDDSQRTSATLFRESPIATSFLGVFYCLKWELSYIYGYQPKDLPVAIINTSSRNGVVPGEERALYSAAKAAIISLTKSVGTQAIQRSIKDKRAPIRINAVSPGPIDTPLMRAIMGTGEEYILNSIKGVPIQRMGKPEEIAPTVLFLADEFQSSYYIGSNLIVDGGSTASPVIPICK
jgi:NAD(P)-dependent dehydrogenase (short-subunit alcohol dehydrogenase family)